MHETCCCRSAGLRRGKPYEVHGCCGPAGHSEGGFLRTGNTTILSAVEDEQVQTLLDVIQANCSERMQVIRPDVIGDYADWYPPHEVEVLVGGATVFVLPVVYFERIV